MNKNIISCHFFCVCIYSIFIFKIKFLKIFSSKIFDLTKSPVCIVEIEECNSLKFPFKTPRIFFPSHPELPVKKSELNFSDKLIIKIMCQKGEKK